MIKMLHKSIKTLQNWESGLYLAKIVLELSPHLLSVWGSSSFRSLDPSTFIHNTPGSYQQTPWAKGNGSYKGNWESFYIRLLLVLAVIYDSTGSSDAGYRAKGEQAVSSKAIQRLVTLKPFPFYCH